MNKRNILKLRILMFLLVILISYYFFSHWDNFEKLIKSLF